MLANDFSEFEALMRQFEKIFGKKIDDETMQLYFGALREIPLKAVKRRAEEYLKRAKFFPKPVDLRPKGDQPKVIRDAATEAAFKDGEQRAIRNLEEVRRQDPDEHCRKVALGKLDYLIATTHESHPAYARILCEWRAARGIHVGEKEWEAVGGR